MSADSASSDLLAICLQVRALAVRYGLQVLESAEWSLAWRPPGRSDRRVVREAESICHAIDAETFLARSKADPFREKRCVRVRFAWRSQATRRRAVALLAWPHPSDRA
jgi:hypothetical protein